MKVTLLLYLPHYLTKLHCFEFDIITILLNLNYLQGVLGDHVYESINGGGHLLGSGISDAEGILCEVVVTLVLVQTVLLTAVDTDGKNPAAPFAIGLAVLVDIMAAYVNSFYCYLLSKENQIYQ